MNYPIQIIKLIKSFIVFRPGVVISILEWDNFLNILTSKLYHHSVILSVHSMPSHHCSGKYNQRIIPKITYCIAKKYHIPIVAVSQGVKDELISLFKLDDNQVSVIYNPIDINLISRLSEEPVEPWVFLTDIPTLITVGGLKNVKAQWHILRVFSELRKRIRCRLIICGDGNLRTFLERMSYEYSVANDVLFIGWQDNPYKYMSKSTVFVSSSLSESFGNVIVEAMACGCPPIVSNCSPAMEEILGSDSLCGIIVSKMSGIKHSPSTPLDETEFSLYEGIYNILMNPTMRETMANECKNRAKYFSLDSSIRDYEEFISRVMN